MLVGEVTAAASGTLSSSSGSGSAKWEWMSRAEGLVDVGTKQRLLEVTIGEVRAREEEAACSTNEHSNRSSANNKAILAMLSERAYSLLEPHFSRRLHGVLGVIEKLNKNETAIKSMIGVHQRLVSKQRNNDNGVCFRHIQRAVDLYKTPNVSVRAALEAVYVQGTRDSQMQAEAQQLIDTMAVEEDGKDQQQAAGVKQEQKAKEEHEQTAKEEQKQKAKQEEQKAKKNQDKKPKGEQEQKDMFKIDKMGKTNEDLVKEIDETAEVQAGSWMSRFTNDVDPPACSFQLMGDRAASRILVQLQRPSEEKRTESSDAIFIVKSDQPVISTSISNCSWKHSKVPANELENFRERRANSVALSRMSSTLREMALPSATRAVYRTCTSGTILDCSALPAFIASNFTEKRIWKKQFVEQEHFKLLFKLRLPAVMHDFVQLLLCLCTEAEFHACWTKVADHHCVFVSDQSFDALSQDAITRAVTQAGVVEISASVNDSGSVKSGSRELTNEQTKKVWKLAHEFELTANDAVDDLSKLIPLNNTTTGFEKQPWDTSGAKVFRSASFTEFIDLICNNKVPGLTNTFGHQLSIKDLLEKLATIQPQIPTLMMGGFIRDVIKNKMADDVDLYFATDKEGIKRMAELAVKEGWPYSLGKVKKGKDTRCGAILEEHNDGYYKHLDWVDAAKQQFPKHNIRRSYISFGRPIDSNGNDLPFAIEGAIPQNPLAAKSDTEPVKFGWGRGDFSCNSLMYCTTNKIPIDPTGRGVGDCQAKPAILRIPYPNEQWPVWKNLLHEHVNIFRWFKFRARGQVAAHDEDGVANRQFVVGELVVLCGNRKFQSLFNGKLEDEVETKTGAQKLQYAAKFSDAVIEDHI